MGWRTKPLAWAAIHWPRPFEPDVALALLIHLATIDRTSQIVFEVRARQGRIHYLIGAEAGTLKHIQQMTQGELDKVRFSSQVKRSEIRIAKSIRLSHPRLAIKEDSQTAITRAVLAALAQTKLTGDETVLQVVLGQSVRPSLLPQKVNEPTATWLDYLRGSLPEASSESRTMLKDKAMQQGFACTVRIGSVAGEPKNYGYPLPKSNQHNSNRSFPRATQHVRNVFTALKVAESAGVYLRAVNDKPRNLNLGKCPWFYPMRLSVKELMSVLAWPLGDEDLPGVAELHPRILLVPNWYKSEERSFGLASGFPGERLKLGISARDSLEHTILLGPTGSGKSTAMLNLILADVMAGRSLLVIDPKADLVNDILARIPKSRISDVVVLDPTDTRPVGFNPLADHVRNPMLVADSVLAVLRDIFADSWGIRTQDILSAALLTLAKTEGASLIWLPALLTDVIFRQRIISKVVPDDPIGLGAFWSGFEAMSLGMQNQSVAPVMNKIRQFLLRPQLRVVLGQTNTKFSLNELFRGTGRKIVLVPLNKGVIGTESARLLGSLIVGQLWTLALERADLPPEQRHIVSLFIDEVQDYLHLPTDLADALAQARGLGVGLTLAHQYRAQLPPELRAGIDANTRNKIIFGLNANDARDMATMAKHDKLEAMDFELLPRFGVYAFLQQNGQATGWLSGSTFPAPPANASAAEVKAASQAKYGQDAETVEQELLELLGHRKAGNSKSESRPTNSTTNDIPIGRKKRGSDDG